jgi:hypothetical protein
MIYCPNCGIANRDGSRFCNECGTKLPSSTSIRCPQCGASNPPNTVFCENCGARLVPSLVDDTPEPESPGTPIKKGLSLPTKPTSDESGPTSDESGPASDESKSAADWLGELRASASMSAEEEAEEASTADDEGVEPQAEELSRLSDKSSPAAASQPPSDQPASPSTPQTADQAGGDVPDWLASLGMIGSTEAEASTPETWVNPAPVPQTEALSEEEETPDWLKELGSTAALEPSAASSEASAPAPAAGPPVDEDLPEWLRSLGTSSLPPAVKPSTPASPFEEEVPEWLRSLGTSPLPSASGTPSREPVTGFEEEVPDWLVSLGTSPLPSAAGKPPAQTTEEEASTEEPTDWLSRLRAAAPEIEEQATAEEETEAPDWLSRLNATLEAHPEAVARPPAEAGSDEKEEPAAGTPPSEVADMPEWLRNLGATAQTQRPATGELPEWLDELSSSIETPPDETTAVSAAPEEEVAEWLRNLGAGIQPPAAEKSGVTDRSLDEERAGPARDQTAEQPEASDRSEAAVPLAEQPPEAAAEETELPEWLKAAEPSADQPAAEAETPDWLRGEEQPELAAEQAAEQVEMPDWLRPETAAAAQPAMEEEPPPAVGEQAAEDVELPDWLKAAKPPVEQPVAEGEGQSELAAEQAAEQVELPDWLKPEAVTEQPAAETEPSQTAGQQEVEAAELPDWLRETGAVESAPPQKPSAEATAAPLEPAELPSWLMGLRPSADTEAAPQPVETEEPAASPELASVAAGLSAAPPAEAEAPVVEAPPTELPDWLKSLRESAPAAPASAPIAAPDLTQAEIPTWLEALRPKEGQATGAFEITEEAEPEGIFAGIPNILPAMPTMGEVQGAPVKLPAEPSTDDLARAGVLQELLARAASAPTMAPTVPERASKAGWRVLQWLIAGLLLLVVIVPYLLDFTLPFLPQVDSLPESALVQQAVTTVESLPPNARVLMMFDYDAAQAGEMNQIAEMFVRHLQTRGAMITIASLNPLGTSLAQAVWRQAGLGAFNEENNLGYVPGQAVGVQNLLAATGPLDLVIDVAASSDSVRWWVEQLAVNGMQVRLTAGVSAAIEPLALPYLQSAQIKGLVPGLGGALQYARQADLLGSLDSAELVQAQYHLEMQTLAHWFLVIVIVIGMLGALLSRGGKRSSS